LESLQFPTRKVDRTAVFVWLAICAILSTIVERLREWITAGALPLAHRS